MNINKYLRYISVFVSLFCTWCAYTQTVCGINISDPNDTTDYVYNNSLDAANSDVYLKNDPGLFDRVLLNKDLGYVCTVNYPNANRFTEIYDDIVKNFGYENDIRDVIPQGVIDNDIIEISILISEGKAQIIRYWYEKKFNIKLEYTQKNLQLY
ncbi:MAG: hypothetical protein HOP31_17280, partial [Ignavibacteria bacterium]|nr:hypothetical protein [Ignavibacteria bacterium]